jgi:CBS domain-containing protein
MLQRRRLQALLEEKNVLDLLNDRVAGSGARAEALIQVSAIESLQTALAVMAKHRLTAVPVQDPTDKQWLGFIDVLDILAAVLRAAQGDHDVHLALPPQLLDGSPYDWLQWKPMLETLQQRGLRLGMLKVDSLLNASSRDLWCPVSASGSLLQLAELFASGVHRVPVESAIPHERARILGVLTQSDLLSFLLEPLALAHDADLARTLHPLLEKTISELNLGGGRDALVTVGVHQTTISAYWTMHVQRVSATAVVDSRGTLLGTLSASDLRQLGSTLSWTQLLEPVSRFLQRAQGARSAPIAITESTPFSVALWKLALYRIHRVWVIDEEQRPVGVVSLTDVIRALVDWCIPKIPEE